MDLAQEVEYKALASYKPVEKLIQNANSNVQLFYKNDIVFLTGGSGFLGKQYIEKMFRTCDIKKMYVLIRPKKGKTIQDRIKFILDDPVFDKLRTTKPNFAEQIVPVEGDVADIRLGLSDKEWETVAKDTSIVVHMAATIRFDSPIKVAVVTNVRGTREVIALAKDCKNLKSFIHVSTGFTHATASRIGTDLREEFHPTPVSPSAIIGMVETMEDSRLDSITAELIKDWPNTYTFTKAIAEELIRTTAADLPVAIVKPPLVLTSYMEPTPGWADTSIMSGPCGVMIGVGLGFLRVFYLKSDLSLNIAPVDIVNNAIIAAGWDSVQNRSKASDGIPIYTVSSTKCEIPWNYLANLTRSEEFKHLASPKAVWYCYLLETKNTYLYLFLFWFLHYIPAYVIDGICHVMGIKIKEIPSATKVYEKIYKMSKVFGYFMTNEWHFKDDNLVAMISRMSDDDRKIYNCDITTVDFKEFTKRMIVGLRKFIVKDGLVDSEKAYVKQKRLWYANLVFMVLYIYVWFMIAFYMFKAVKYIPFSSYQNTKHIPTKKKVELKMDAAQAVILKALEGQKGTKTAIDRGDSKIQQFYKDRTVFLTGASGFLGKQLVEKLFRIIPIIGELAEKNLGISETDRRIISKEVDVIYHVAATISFQEPLRSATLINVRGTKEIITLAKQCERLRSFVYMSTAYSHATFSRGGTEIMEEFYTSPMPPELMIDLAESLEEERLNRIKDELIRDWPNTYSFTKALAEELLRMNSKELPVSVIRPAVVVCARREPYAGWIDLSSVFGPSGDIRIDFVPVDYVNNTAIIAAASSNNVTKIYHVATSKRNHLTWGGLTNILNNVARRTIVSPHAIWYCFVVQSPYLWLHQLVSFLLHTIPANLVDGLCVLMKKPPRLKKIYSTVTKMASTIAFYSNHGWIFNDRNTLQLFKDLSNSDKIIYHCDVSDLEWTDFIVLWCVGLRKYIVKDDLNTTEKGMKKQNVFRITTYVISFLFFLIICILFMLFFNLFNILFGIIF
ncbi:hypothetical protein HW555_010211 [Spodoptera exigua]|uniref:Fatty acyl-CoA reductase n=1 Tax=Spodoptera exigua TaxID=7107 RepID=A0A835G989_SPOEX|nr:hypothetical protein HW555_010211 [Spodoptera exigua]